jgi:hypothetical protein
MVRTDPALFYAAGSYHLAFFLHVQHFSVLVPLVASESVLETVPELLARLPNKIAHTQLLLPGMEYFADLQSKNVIA